MPDALTDRQTDVLRFIRSYVRRHRAPPTIQEIADAFGLRSNNSVVKHLRALEKKGFIKREPHQARGLRLVQSGATRTPGGGDIPTLPVLGSVSSGAPDQLREMPAAYLAVDPYFLRHARTPERCLIGRASDDGMAPDHIRTGDLLLIEEEKLPTLAPDVLCAVLVDRTLLVRRVVVTQGHIALRASDPSFTEETFLTADPGCHVIGRVLGVLRRM